jgi:hypothetical protein
MEYFCMARATSMASIEFDPLNFPAFQYSVFLAVSAPFAPVR